MGMLLYELATREHPFQTEVWMEDFFPRFVQSGGRPTISPDHHIPPGFRELIEQSWHQIPAQRPSMERLVGSFIAIVKRLAADDPAYVPLFSTFQVVSPDTEDRQMRGFRYPLEDILPQSRFIPSVGSHPASVNNSYGSLKKPLRLRFRCLKCLKYTMGMSSHCPRCNIRICSQCLKNHSCIDVSPHRSVRIAAILLPNSDPSRLWFGRDNGTIGMSSVSRMLLHHVPLLAFRNPFCFPNMKKMPALPSPLWPSIRLAFIRPGSDRHLVSFVCGHHSPSPYPSLSIS